MAEVRHWNEIHPNEMKVKTHDTTTQYIKSGYQISLVLDGIISAILITFYELNLPVFSLTCITSGSYPSGCHPSKGLTNDVTIPRQRWCRCLLTARPTVGVVQHRRGRWLTVLRQGWRTSRAPPRTVVMLTDVQRSVNEHGSSRNSLTFRFTNRDSRWADDDLFELVVWSVTKDCVSVHLSTDVLLGMTVGKNCWWSRTGVFRTTETVGWDDGMWHSLMERRKSCCHRHGNQMARCFTVEDLVIGWRWSSSK